LFFTPAQKKEPIPKGSAPFLLCRLWLDLLFMKEVGCLGDPLYGLASFLVNLFDNDERLDSFFAFTDDMAVNESSLDVQAIFSGCIGRQGKLI